MAFHRIAMGGVFGVLMASAASVSPAPAADLPAQKYIPSAIAVKFAEAAIQACRAEGYGVTAVVVNTEGNVIVQIRGDGARVQTVETARNKAYSAVTLAANHNLDLTSGILASMQAKGAVGVGAWPMPPAPSTNITLFAGGVNLRSNGEIVGALGVSGTPNGKLDEGCALKARDAMSGQL
ncbi:heme-binding protein [Cyanobium sp. WAJ14-Wanaka]|uniref:GlcG/HbpS family heme-binding protein n=1 Tax=Cyanobium sp. WAJ14-Wanaka TaxID=2823725 RepID=UPI0020CF8EB0|nr:heme-binding protein [Cyanobium sp. WAJ14-Wanaka]